MHALSIYHQRVACKALIGAAYLAWTDQLCNSLSLSDYLKLVWREDKTET